MKLSALGCGLAFGVFYVTSIAATPPAYLPPGNPLPTNTTNCQATTIFDHVELGSHCEYYNEVMTGIEQLTPQMEIDCAQIQITCTDTASQKTQPKSQESNE